MSYWQVAYLVGLATGVVIGVIAYMIIVAFKNRKLLS